MIYEQIETEIVAHLQPLEGAGVDVVALPENEAGYQRAFKRGRVTVAYKDSEFRGGDLNNNNTRTKSLGDMIVQDEMMHFELVLESMKLRGPSGIYTLAAAVRELMLGFRPTKSGKFYMAPRGTQMAQRDKDDKTWFMVLTFITDGMAVEYVNEYAGPVVTMITGADLTTNDDPAFILEDDNSNGKPDELE